MFLLAMLVIIELAWLRYIANKSKTCNRLSYPGARFGRGNSEELLYKVFDFCLAIYEIRQHIMNLCLCFFGRWFYEEHLCEIF